MENFAKKEEATVKKEEKVVKKPEFSREEKEIMDKFEKSYKDIARDDKQESVSFKEYLEKKLDCLVRVRERNMERVKSEVPNDTHKNLAAVVIEGAKIYSKEIANLETILKKL